MEAPDIGFALEKIAKQLTQHNFQCYLVGGAIRNHLLGYPIKDYDLATDALPYQVMTLFKRVVPTGIEHGTVTVIEGGNAFEVTTFRADGEYTDGRRPDKVEFIPDITEDLKRRDFTINSIAYNLKTCTYYDPNGGVVDLDKKIIKAIGNPVERFTEDGLRPLRALRFVAQLGFELEENTYLAISQCFKVIQDVSKERVRDELQKMFVATYAVKALNLMRDSGLMFLLLPELYNCRFHNYNKNLDLLSHQISALNAIPVRYPVARWAALFAYIAFPMNSNELSGEEFLLSEKLAAKSSAMFSRLGKDDEVGLRLPNIQIKEIRHLIENQQCRYQKNWTDGQIRHLIAKIGLPLWPSYLALIEGQRNVVQNPAFSTDGLEDLKRRAEAILAKPLSITLNDLVLKGSDLLVLGIPKNEEMGLVLKELLKKVIDEPSLNTREQLVCIVEQYLQNRKPYKE